MGFITFISGDGVKHEVEETSVAADIMRQNGFQEVECGKVDDQPETAEITYTETDAIAQNDGENASTAAKEAAAAKSEAPEAAAPKKAPAKKK